MSQNQVTKKGSKRVQAWLYEVINPIVEVAIPQENKFLNDHNWTWRFWSRKCEFIHHFQDYLDFVERPNYDDFCSKYPGVASKFEDHDRMVSRLSEYALELFQALCRHAQFQDKVKEALASWTSENASRACYPGGAVSQEQFHMLMAQNIINNLQELPEYYSDAQFWRRFGKEFRATAPQALTQKLSQTGEALVIVNGDVTQLLREIRLALCDEYDIPPAPLRSYQDDE